MKTGAAARGGVSEWRVQQGRRWRVLVKSEQRKESRRRDERERPPPATQINAALNPIVARKIVHVFTLGQSLLLLMYFFSPSSSASSTSFSSCVTEKGKQKTLTSAYRDVTCRVMMRLKNLSTLVYTQDRKDKNKS